MYMIYHLPKYLYGFINIKINFKYYLFLSADIYVCSYKVILVLICANFVTICNSINFSKYLIYNLLSIVYVANI